jgi:hypothetical protein
VGRLRGRGCRHPQPTRRSADDGGEPARPPLGVEQDIADTVRRGWNGLGLVADHHLVASHRLLTVDSPMEQPVDLRLALTGGDLVVPATLRYSVRPVVIDVRASARSSSRTPTSVAGR